MSYQVLARKWRPQTFHELVGQTHVKQALVNALNEQRLHHAYLFTGTRGVGKTTIARIFAKSLNCEQGISANPCGRCQACLDIEAGKYIDLLEIDAASRTKVEDTREILDNVQYAPSRGKYKVYLIDEVHMLSKHSFNALLKTLEEPPEHVKFLLATTDPQKLPITILSRCLQFNLNALPQQAIADQLASILDKEGIAYESPALMTLARAADGSMRDALSLTDQAVAQTAANITAEAVKTMLGLMDVQHAQHLFAALLCHDGEALMAKVAELSQRNPNYTALLDDMLALAHLIQLTQLVPSAAELNPQYCAYAQDVAAEVDPQQIQVYYQLLLNGKRDLQWAPDPRSGFEMLMLRLLAFRPVQPGQAVASPAATPQARPSLRSLLQKQSVQAPAPQAAVEEPATPAGAETAHTRPEQTPEAMPEPAPIAAQNPVEPPVAAEVPAQAMPPRHETPAPVAAPDNADLPDEDNLAAQFNDILESAKQQGYQGDDAFEVQDKPEASEPQAPAQQFAALERGAQSAIERILQNRNISGTGQFTGSGEPSAKKTEPLPSQGEVSVAERPKRDKVAFADKHKADPAHLAPELLEQIAPSRPVPEADNVPAQPDVPEDFESPISSIKFAHQQDEWAHLIKRMGLGGRMRQFALHSIYRKDGQQLSLEVDESQKHLDSTMLRQKLIGALSDIYGYPVELAIDFAPGVIDSPYLIQQKIDAHRQQQAIEVMQSDENVAQFTQLFSATLDENSVKAL